MAKKKTATPKKKKAAKPKPRLPMKGDAPGKTAAAPKSRKEQRASGMGHNLAEIRRAAMPAMTRLFALQASMDKDAAGYRSDFATVYEEEAKNIGVKKAVLIKEFKRALRAKREEEKELMMDAQERNEAETLRAAFDGTPFGKWFEGEIAKPKDGDGPGIAEGAQDETEEGDDGDSEAEEPEHAGVEEGAAVH